MEQSKKSQKIVIVEDNIALADIYKTRLELIGYTCFVANDGIAGLYLIQKELPDLVLLDLMVPAIAGDQILVRMRASSWGKHTPVFIISNLNEADAPAGLRDLDIVGYVVKASLADDGLDKIVNSVLGSAEEVKNTLLQTPENLPTNSQHSTPVPDTTHAPENAWPQNPPEPSPPIE